VATPSLVVFVHGWSVRSTDTYGQLPECLAAEAGKRGLAIGVRHVFLGRYVSFRDEVTVDDIARGFEHAVRTELADVVSTRRRFACITHSTGGPVVRHWWRRFSLDPSSAPQCPMSHLIMLAPANFGAALAQLGAGRLSRMKSWAEGVQPGAGVLDWLELGSPESWELNHAWIRAPRDFAATGGVFPFVLTGQTIDRALYDHVNSYTGEPGSDGVVRAAAANLNASAIRLVQESTGGSPSRLVAGRAARAPTTAFKIVPGRAHSGADIGIMRSVRAGEAEHPTVTAVLRCLQVGTPAAYRDLTAAFTTENDVVQREEQVNVRRRKFLPDQTYIVDRFSQVIVRIRDDQGRAVGNYDLTLLGVPAGAGARVRPSPDLLPRGFLQDRQRNRRDPGTLTFYINHALMTGTGEVRHPRSGDLLRPAVKGLEALGLMIEPHLSSGFAHFVKGRLEAERALVARLLQPNQTTLVDIVMRRIVRRGVVRLDGLRQRNDRDFSADPPGPLLP